MDPGVREELVEVGEALDVADLRQEGRDDRRADAGDRLEATGRLAVEETRDAPVGVLDLALEQIVLVEQRPTSKATSASSSGTAIESAAAAWSRSAFAVPRRR
jgi:hypothetical protein